MGTFGIIVILILVVVIVAIAFTSKVNADHKSKSQDILSSIQDFSPTDTFLSSSSGTSISYDGINKKICLIDSFHNKFVYNYNDILQSELVIDGETISKHSTSSTIGRAVLGGILLGGVGAVIGGATSSKREKEKIKSIDLKISVNDTKNPFFKVNFLNLETKKGSMLYNLSYQLAERWHGIFSAIIRQGNDLEKQYDKADANFDDLFKLKALLDSGIISQSEFNSQKEKILSGKLLK